MNSTDNLSIPGDVAPALIEGAVMHARQRPKRNAFIYPAFCLRVPLSNIEALPAAGIARNRRAWLSFDDRDHGPRDGSSLEAWVRQLLVRENVQADGEVVLYAFPRMLGYVFNPVCFWVCHDRGGSVRAVLVQVTNTFGEHHDYLLAHRDGTPIRSGHALEAVKAFHVSPFCTVSGRYRFRFLFDSTRWLARIDYFDDASTQPLLATSISGTARVLNRRAARGLLFRYPGFTAAVVARIHWQALKLWLKRVPFVSKPAPPLSPLSR